MYRAEGHNKLGLYNARLTRRLHKRAYSPIHSFGGPIPGHSEVLRCLEPRIPEDPRVALLLALAFLGPQAAGLLPTTSGYHYGVYPSGPSLHMPDAPIQATSLPPVSNHASPNSHQNHGGGGRLAAPVFQDPVGNFCAETSILSTDGCNETAVDDHSALPFAGARECTAPNQWDGGNSVADDACYQTRLSTHHQAQTANPLISTPAALTRGGLQEILPTQQPSPMPDPDLITDAQGEEIQLHEKPVSWPGVYKDGQLAEFNVDTSRVVTVTTDSQGGLRLILQRNDGLTIQLACKDGAASWEIVSPANEGESCLAAPTTPPPTPTPPPFDRNEYILDPNGNPIPLDINGKTEYLKWQMNFFGTGLMSPRVGEAWNSNVRYEISQETVHGWHTVTISRDLVDNGNVIHNTLNLQCKLNDDGTVKEILLRQYPLLTWLPPPLANLLGIPYTYQPTDEVLGCPEEIIMK
ncbi:MAG: hypothetical protein V1922_04470 [bacterium]